MASKGHVLSALKAFSPTQWYTKSMQTLAKEIVSEYAKRTEITSGGLLTKGSTFNDVKSDITMAEMVIMMGGVISTVSVITDKDITDGEGAYGQAIWSDGSNGNTIDLDTSAKAYITVIFCNSDGAGGTSTTPLVIAVVAGTGPSPTATAHLTTAEINYALSQSTGVHAGVTEWCHIGRFENHQGSAAIQNNTENRNNHLEA
jgi:hypothetical protein